MFFCWFLDVKITRFDRPKRLKRKFLPWHFRNLCVWVARPISCENIFSKFEETSSEKIRRRHVFCNRLKSAEQPPRTGGPSLSWVTWPKKRFGRLLPKVLSDMATYQFSWSVSWIQVAFLKAWDISMFFKQQPEKMGGNFLPNWHPKPLFVGSHKMAFVFVFAGAKITKNHKHAKGWGPHPRVQAARLLRVHLSGSCMAQATRKNETPCTFQRPHWKVICWQVAFFFFWISSAPQSGQAHSDQSHGLWRNEETEEGVLWEDPEVRALREKQRLIVSHDVTIALNYMGTNHPMVKSLAGQFLFHSLIHKAMFACQMTELCMSPMFTLDMSI